MTPPGAEPDRARFRRLAYLTAALTFALIVVGGVVRISDSGLGCGPAGSGTEGWPLCGGGVVPVIDTNMIIEYTHRVLAAAVTLLIAYLVWTAWRHRRSERLLVRVSFATLGLILVQAALGGLTVEEGLKQELVATHLGVAMVQIALVLLMGRLGGPDASPSLRPGATRAIRGLTGVALVALLGTIVAGGYMSASELHGTGAEHRSVDAHMACGQEFPACGGEFLPFGRSEALDIHLTHRVFMYVTVVVLLALFVTVVRQRRRLEEGHGADLANLAWVTVVILIAQVMLGAVNVWAGEQAWLIVAHLAVGTLLWLSLIRFAFSLTSVPEASAAAGRRRTPAEAATA
jgi:cytochrome c oxidase assembly protein subunit 15